MIEVHGKLDLINFYTAMSTLEKLDGDISSDGFTAFIHPKDLRDAYEWDIQITGQAFRDRITEFEKSKDTVTHFGHITFVRTEDVPQGLTVLISPKGNVESLKKVGE